MHYTEVGRGEGKGVLLNTNIFPCTQSSLALKEQGTLAKHYTWVMTSCTLTKIPEVKSQILLIEHKSKTRHLMIRQFMFQPLHCAPILPLFIADFRHTLKIAWAIEHALPLLLRSTRVKGHTQNAMFKHK